jgi:nitric oxide reductase activation protein
VVNLIEARRRIKREQLAAALAKLADGLETQIDHALIIGPVEARLYVKLLAASERLRGRLVDGGAQDGRRQHRPLTPAQLAAMRANAAKMRAAKAAQRQEAVDAAG